MAGEVIFIIKPQPDACTRCKQIAYVNGEDDSDGYKFHVAPINEVKHTNPIHPHCRCQVEIIGTPEELKEKESVEEIAREEKDKAEELTPDNIAGFRPSPIRKTQHLFYRGTARQFISYHSRYRRQPGTTFFTIVIDTINKLLSKLAGFFVRED